MQVVQVAGQELNDETWAIAQSDLMMQDIDPARMRNGNTLTSDAFPTEKFDFILANRTRIRAKFDNDCPALDYYGGLYLVPDDELLCARRDTIRSRMGGSCEIRRFKLLLPKLRD